MKPIKKQTLLLIAILSLLTIISNYKIAHAKVTSYNINGVYVNVQSSSSAKAREKAFAIGKQKAFAMLMEELVMASDLKKLPPLENNILSSYVASFGVQSSKTTQKSFLGVLNFTFDSKKVNNFLRSSKVNFVRISKKPVLIVPVSKFGTQYMIGYAHDTTKLWQKSWRETRTSNYGLVSFKYLYTSSVLPKSLSPNLLVKGDRRAILALRRHFGLLDIAIVYIASGKGGLAGRVLYVPIHNKRKILNISHSPNYNDSIHKAKKLISSYWKLNNMQENSNTDSKIQIVSTIRKIQPWLRLKRYITSVGTNTHLVSLQMGHMALVTDYPGGGKYLAHLLRGYGYNMVYKDSYWEISLIGQSAIKNSTGKKGNVKKIDSAPVKSMNAESSNLPMAN